MMNEWFEQDAYEESIKINLLRLLEKLGILSASYPYNENYLGKAMRNFGVPDQIYVNPHTLSVIEKLFKKP